MPLYAGADDVRRVLTGDPDRVRGTAAELEDSVINTQIDHAEAEINAALRSRYVIPFVEPVPVLVKAITADLAAFLATLVYRKGRDVEPTDPVSIRENRSRKLLTRIADGASDLDQDVGGRPSRGSIRPPNNPSAGKLFGPGDFGLGRGGRARYRDW